MMGKCYRVNYASGNILGLPSPDGSQNGIWYFPVTVLCKCYQTTTKAPVTTPTPSTLPPFCHGTPERRVGAKAGLLEDEAQIKAEFNKVWYVWDDRMRGMMGKCYTVNYANGNILGLPSPDGSQNGIWYFPITVLCKCYQTTTKAPVTT